MIKPNACLPVQQIVENSKTTVDLNTKVCGSLKGNCVKFGWMFVARFLQSAACRPQKYHPNFLSH